MDALTPPPSRPRPAPAPAAQEAAGHPAAGHRVSGRRGHLRLVTTGAIPRARATGAAPPGADGRRAAMPELTRRPSAPRRPPRPGGATRSASRRSAARPVPFRTDPALGGAGADRGRAPSRSDPARLAPMHPAVRAQRRRREAARTPGRAAPTCAPAVVRAAALPAVAVVLRRAGAAGLAALAPFLLALVGIALIG